MIYSRRNCQNKCIITRPFDYQSDGTPRTRFKPLENELNKLDRVSEPSRTTLLRELTNQVLKNAALLKIARCLSLAL